MRWRELRLRAAVALRRRVPGGRALQRRLVREDLRDLRRVEPVSAAFGFDRGTPVDRVYIEEFLRDNASAIAGRVLEVGDRRYTDAFGHPTTSDVLAPEPGKGITVVADLVSGEGVPEGVYDCVIATQVLNVLYEVAAAVQSLHRALAHGGVLLATMPGISAVSDYDDERWGDHWRFTEASARRLFCSVFGDDAIDVRSYGNVLAASAFLYGLAAEELSGTELTSRDRRYPVVIAVRAARR